jgi:hypothetical protein
MRPRRAAQAAGGALLAGALLTLAWSSPDWLAYNMDEFVHYHALGCATAPLSRGLPTYRDGCGLYDLRLPFTTLRLPLRSYYYIGSLPAVVFVPFWALFDDPVAARVQGGVFFLAATVLAARLLRVRPGAAALAGFAFPVYGFSFLADEGPVGLSILLLLGALLAIRRAVDAKDTVSGASWGGLASVLLFLGLWVKLVFAWWVPAVLAWTVLEVRRREKTVWALIQRRRATLLAGAFAFVLPTLTLLASTDTAGLPYYAALRKSGLSSEPVGQRAIAARLIRYVTDGSLVAPRNLELPSSVLDPLPAVASVILLGVSIARPSGRRREILTWTLLALLTFALVATSRHSRWPHHVVLALVFLVFALALALDTAGRRRRAAFALVTALFWASLALRWPGASVLPDSNAAKDELLAFVRAKGLDRETLQVHASWGTYYIAQLFGARERTVLYLRALPDQPEALLQVRDVARSRRRPVLVMSDRRWERLQTPEVERILGRPVATHRFGNWWAVLYDPLTATPG